MSLFSRGRPDHLSSLTDSVTMGTRRSVQFFFAQEAFVSSSGMGRDIHSFNVVYPAFPPPTTVSPALQSVLKDGFGDREADVARDMPEPCEFPFLDSGKKGFLEAHKEVDLSLYLVVSLLLHL